MTMQRGSIIFAAEGYAGSAADTGKTEEFHYRKTNFGKGRGFYKKSQEYEVEIPDPTDPTKKIKAKRYRSVRCPWIQAPTGTFFGTEHNRTAAPIRAMGTKTWDTVQYGTFTGSFNWTFTLDYKYLHPLMLFFEKYTLWGLKDDEAGGAYVIHKFQKKDNKRVRSFTIRRVILNEIAGGPENSDEVMQLFGCVARNVSFSKSATGSDISVSINGVYVSEQMYKGTLEATDYKDNTGQLTEYLCMLVNDEKGKDVEDCTYVANTESVSISIENNVDRVYNTCNPYASAYYEGLSNYKLSTSIYSNNPGVYKQRIYGGGRQVLVEGGVGTIMSLTKGLKPLGTVKLIAYTGMGVTSPAETLDMEKMAETFRDSDKSLEISVEDMIIKSLTWPKGEGQKIVDNISSQECKYLTFAIKAQLRPSNSGGVEINEDMQTFDICEDPKYFDKLSKIVIPTEGPDW